MPFRTQMTNIYSFFSYLKIYPPFLAKNFTSLLGLKCVTPSRVTFPNLNILFSYSPSFGRTLSLAFAEAEFLDEIQTKVLRVFLLVVGNHIYSFT
jgi:hypothetical protein